MLNVDEISYGGWERCLRIRNCEMELVITTAVGPRIIRFGMIGGPNEFVEYPDQLGKAWGKVYKSYGGHRLWVAPEDPETTYFPDNRPVLWSVLGDTLSVTAPVEEGTALQKELAVIIDPEINTVQVRHRIHNRGSETKIFSAWALSVMAPGGKAFLPQEEFHPHPERLLPARPLVLWSYTRMNDPRWRWGAAVISLRQDPAIPSPQKIGARNSRGWLAYRNGDRLFIKTVAYDPAATYPDFGSNCELFVNGKMLELETLGPLRSVPPGGFMEHDEHWFLFRLPASADSREDPDGEVAEIEQLLKNRL